MSLKQRLEAEIAATGPMSVADYMSRCLHDPAEGYYATRPALGADGDFLTAPLVSQMFGELIGLWAVETWRRLGSPSPFRLVEMGPGDGTLMADLLRAVRLAPDFLASADLWLVETSAPLVERQKGRLAEAAPRWAARFDEVPAGAPMILIANELLDCLPARQFVRTERGWAERRIGLGHDGRLSWGLGAALRPEGAPDRLEPDLVWEVSAAQAALGVEIGVRIAVDGGCALLIDYGRDRPGPGDTFQALRRHRKENPLAHPGEADLTVWADFPSVLAAARKAGAETAPILEQGEFLGRLGIAQRAQVLARAQPGQADVIERQFARLVEPDQMGRLFKAVAIHSAGLAPPAFEESR